MPLHILHGAETFARAEALRKLKESLDTDGSLATNTITLDARQSSLQEVMAACDTIPFLGDTRLVIVEGVLESTGKPKRGGKKKASEVEPGDSAPSQWEALTDYIDRMPPSTTLVLVDGAVPADGLLKVLKPKGAAQSFPIPGDKELAGWVGHRAKTLGIKIDAPAARLLAELVGADLWALAGEIDKLSVYANGESIREADVRALVSRAKEHKGWELSDAVVEGQSAKAARIVLELVEDGEAPQVLLSTVAGRYRRIAIARDMLDRGESNSAIAQRVNMKVGYGLDKLIEQARRHSPERIRRIYGRIIQAETDVKQFSMNYQLAVELAVQEIASAPPRG